MEGKKFCSSEKVNDIFAALSKCQGAIESAKKKADNPFFKSKYADLPVIIGAVKEPLSENGLSLMQHPSGTDGKVGLTTVLAHSSGQWVSSYYEMTPKDHTPQGYGSAITYMRRYALGAILNVPTEKDDDGNAASGKTEKSAPVTSNDFEI
jgi:hypothetical protein